ncbi:uncharacterized protein BDZ99DRAFT_481383 [Mytilinidion resinicola]|uniref:Uncharacterized protein n=1 Tax=Mytilinidion resinicola TaxID=574789 RepID=A0A6A6Y603_9PEZI|nr:uncharacterized protein BDZ99DRAFT_481383 [Mytilinidion resinicola]KAF2804222.1 hypothetical protein BDZ99DRAFT_481383 [Mytilinidion resinicola]
MLSASTNYGRLTSMKANLGTRPAKKSSSVWSKAQPPELPVPESPMGSAKSKSSVRQDNDTPHPIDPAAYVQLQKIVRRLLDSTMLLWVAMLMTNCLRTQESSRPMLELDGSRVAQAFTPVQPSPSLGTSMLKDSSQPSGQFSNEYQVSEASEACQRETCEAEDYE